MEGQQVAGANSQASSLAVGLNGPPFLSNLISSEASSNGINLIDIPLTLSAFNGYNPNLTFSGSDDLIGGSSVNLSLNSFSDASLFKMSDNGGLLTTGDSLSKSGDSSKSPLELMVSSDNLQIQGQSSPAMASAPTGAQFQSVVSGGDKMLSAVNNLHFNDTEMLGDSGFDAAPSGLNQFDDGLLSSLGNSTGQGMAGSSSFDLFDGGVADTLSLSPQPFQDSGLMAATDSPVLDTGLILQQPDSVSENSSIKSTGNKTPSSSVSSPEQNKYAPSQCPVCGKTFNNIGALAKHRLTHSDERKYVCNVCSKGFKRQDHLNGHLMTHLEKKPYECQLPSCDKGYCDARSLRRHLEQHHHLDPETIVAHVHASMAAAGIPPPTPRSSGGASSKKESRSKQLSSPQYSPGSATPTPSPGASGAGNAFHFDSQQQKQQQELLVVQQIHQQQKLILQQQKQQKLQEELKAKELKGNTGQNTDVSRQLHLQLQQQQQSKSQQQQQGKPNKTQTQQQQGKSQQQTHKSHQGQQQKQPADMLAVMQQVQQLQQQIHQQHQLEMQRKKEREANNAAQVSTTKNSQPTQQKQQQQQQDAAWQDRAGVYTFVSTPTSSEVSPVSRSDQSPGAGGIVMAAGQTNSPVSPATGSGIPTGTQPRSPMANSGSRTNWFPSTEGGQMKIDEAAKNQAYCKACDRYFKNAAALNGHMRCHGGFLRKTKEKDTKKSPVRKNSNSSSSDMGPPLRRPPHISTPSPQSAMARTSPTTPTPSTFSPNPGSVSSDQHLGSVEMMSVGSPSDHQLLQNMNLKQEGSGSELVLTHQKHKHLQEQLSSHILKRRMSGEQQLRRQQQQQLQNKPVQQQLQPNQQPINFLGEHIKSQQQPQQQLQQQQQQQFQDQSQQNIQMLPGQFLGGDGTDLPVVESNPPTRSMSPHQGEHIQRLVQSFQQVEELQRQSQQQAQLNVSPEQLEQIRQQHKLLGLPPLNPQQLHYQLQEQQAQQAQIVQAQMREQQQIQEMQQQQQQQFQEQQHQASLVMATTSSPSSAQILDPQQQTGTLVQQLNNNMDNLSFNPQGILSPTALSTQHVFTNSTNPTATVTPLNTSVQQILAALDPSIVTAAGINLGDHQNILLQLHKQQQQQQEHGDNIGMLSGGLVVSNSNSASTGAASSVSGSLMSGVQYQASTEHLNEQSSTLLQSGLQQLPQILLQPPDADDLGGVPTISIPDSAVVLTDHMGGSMLQQQQQQQQQQQHHVAISQQHSPSEREQIERIQSRLMASVVEKQHQQSVMASGGAALTHPHVAQSLDSPSISSSVANNSFINIQSTPFQNNLVSQPVGRSQQLREKSKPGHNSHLSQKQQQQQQQRNPSAFLSVSSASPSLNSPSTSSAVARNTDAAVAQILKNISNSMAGGESSGALAAAAAAAAAASAAASGSGEGSIDINPSTQASLMSNNPGTDMLAVEDQTMSYTGLRDTYESSPSMSRSFKLDSIKQDVMLSSAVSSDAQIVSNDPLSSLRDANMLPSYCSPSTEENGHNPHGQLPSFVPISGTNNSKLRRLSADLESSHSRRGNLFAHQRQNAPSSKKLSSDSNPHHLMVDPQEVEGLTNLGLGGGVGGSGKSESRVRARSKSGDVHHQHKYSRSKSIDHSTLLRHRSLTGDSLTRPSGGLRTSSLSHPEDIFARSDGADVFRNPGSLPSPLKIKRKHRPAPLYIPPHFGFFQSRLRSPRVISGGSLGDRTGGLGRGLHTGHTPPPYTPPPMLSPFRSGSGLFCTLQSAQPQTPKSAPVSGKILSHRKGSLSSVKSELGIEPFTEQVEEESPPETDTEAHINIGPEFQAVLPEFREKSEAKASPAVRKEWVMWHPSSEQENTDSQLQNYQDFSCSAAVRGNGRNVEYALHLLHLAGGDIQEAMLMLMGEPPRLPAGHPMLDYKYQVLVLCKLSRSSYRGDPKSKKKGKAKMDDRRNLKLDGGKEMC
ncbi:protein odd-skipped-related 1 [Plakobranchus ocellatus]|uniref:Protein odd-skipped-related 1 n=1 Tax=Plakobranchus ocellatus TaxID=259542 RepID=A0AAV3ZW75_9GAST|nr:protein odd-skipped-related 1 [Plakobranchus ocellatus]